MNECDTHLKNMKYVICVIYNPAAGKYLRAKLTPMSHRQSL